MLITECEHSPDFISVANGEFRCGLVIRIQMCILDTMFCFQTHPFDIMRLVHRMLYGAYRYVDGIPVHLINRDMLLSRGFRHAGNQLPHFFTAAVERNAFIPDHGYNIAAMLTDHQFLFHFNPSLRKSVSKIKSIMHKSLDILSAKGCEIMDSIFSYKRGFVPYALSALLIGLVGGFSTVLGPAFVQDIGIAYNNTTWTALAQAMSSAACAPILGKVGDVIGRRKTLLLGIVVFTFGNFLSALANSLVFMMVSRFIVGVGTAAIGPVILAYIATEFPQDRIAKGFSLYMLLSSASVIIGPTIGGLIVSSYGWRSMLWVCIAISVGILVACVYTSRNQVSTKKPLQNFDVSGAILILIFFSLLLCIPSFGQNFGWTSLPFLFVLVASVITLIGLICAERKSAYPILSGEFMGRSAFILSVLALFLTQGLMQANMTNTIVFVNYTQPENSAISGYAISVMYVGMSLGAVILGPLADKFNPKRILIGSFLLTGIGCGILLLFT